MPLLALHQVASRSLWEGVEMAGQEEPGLYVVAAAYELSCECDEVQLNTQLTELPRPEPEEDGVWVWVCPRCKFRHCFDGGDVNHAF